MVNAYQPRAPVNQKNEPDAEVRHGYRCPTAYFPKAAPFTQRAIQREMQRVRGKSEYVQKVALSRTTAADDHRQGPQRDIAGSVAAGIFGVAPVTPGLAETVVP